MRELMKMKVGFAEIEQFSADLNSKFRSRKFINKQNSGEMTNPNMVKACMDPKMRDEV